MPSREGGGMLELQIDRRMIDALILKSVINWTASYCVLQELYPPVFQLLQQTYSNCLVGSILFYK